MAPTGHSPKKAKETAQLSSLLSVDPLPGSFSLPFLSSFLLTFCLLLSLLSLLPFSSFLVHFHTGIASLSCTKHRAILSTRARVVARLPRILGEKKIPRRKERIARRPLQRQIVLIQSLTGSGSSFSFLIISFSTVSTIFPRVQYSHVSTIRWTRGPLRKSIRSFT